MYWKGKHYQNEVNTSQAQTKGLDNPGSKKEKNKKGETPNLDVGIKVNIGKQDKKPTFNAPPIGKIGVHKNEGIGDSMYIYLKFLITKDQMDLDCHWEEDNH
jgi:hypothetical protein